MTIVHIQLWLLGFFVGWLLYELAKSALRGLLDRINQWIDKL